MVILGISGKIRRGQRSENGSAERGDLRRGNRVVRVYLPGVRILNRNIEYAVALVKHLGALIPQRVQHGFPPTKWPETFVRGADSVLAPYGDLVKPDLSERFDYEGELGLVIGRGGRYIPA